MKALELNNIIVPKEFNESIVLLETLVDNERVLRPVIVADNGTLIFGKNRIEAYTTLGATSIPVIMVMSHNGDDEKRPDLTPTEAFVAFEYYKPMWERELVSQLGKQRRPLHPFDGHLNKSIGYGRDSMNKVGKLVRAVIEEPEKYGSLIAEMDKTEKITTAFKKLCELTKEKRIHELEEAPVRGIKKVYLLLAPAHKKQFRQWLKSAESECEDGGEKT